MKKVLMMAFYIDENEEEEARRIVRGVTAYIRTSYYSRKTGKAVAKVEDEEIQFNSYSDNYMH